MITKLERLLLVLTVLLCTNCVENKEEKVPAPKIVNIVNFIRQLEPRNEEITEDVLYETVHEQIKLMTQYKLPGTFLLQYDALMNPRYQALLKEEIKRGSEVGGWWEITQPHVEAAGLKWRGRYPWDWHADVGFATGYTPQEREKLVDVYMEKFKSIFGKYPASIGSWFIDAHSLAYMYDKYGIVASCNCKDQVGTDGYTLWGGYWNQAYYPSRKNAYMPAQNIDNQIPVPIFRMLGSDPIYQYDNGIGGNLQGVITLEPVYGGAGSDLDWVKWFVKTIAEEPCLAFNYAQAGQENSFTWNVMQKGFEIQMPLLAAYRDSNKIRVETLEESGKWFKKQFPLTPATAFTALTDVRDEGRKTVWFNSRYYRANLLWEGNTVYFRDIHLFDEQYPSDYLTKAGTSNQCVYTTLPIIDGCLWSNAEKLAGLRFKQINKDGSRESLALGTPVVTEPSKGVLQIECKATSGNIFRILFYEDRFEVKCEPITNDFSWVLEFTKASNAPLPFFSIGGKSLDARLNGFDYKIYCKEGHIEIIKDVELPCFHLIPSNNILVVDCTNHPQ
ncbi:hypothetical protein [Parabacteroides pacaensis]|uniref:hypothetical protein n=1 Tax=Parabacteroides pacaensis TaxID=2086575 RepID=UPI000D0F8696|nr:hypothetical protein [Parabacteroides pacaensis]